MTSSNAKKAMTDSVISCHPQLYRFLLRRLKNSSDAQDLAQEAYLRLLRVDNPELVRQPAAYLFRIAANLVHEFMLRQHREEGTVSLEALAEEPSSADGHTPEHQAETEEVIRRVEAQLKTLPPLCAAIFILRKRDGLSHQEIAEQLNLSLHTVRKYLTRAVAQCRTVEDTE